jgi:hypothetical protein
MTVDADNKSSTDLEREVESTRAGLEDTLGELRERVQPRAVMDEVWEFASGSGGGDFVKNLGRTARDNPVPVALIGAGIAWLISGRGPSFGDAKNAVTSRFSDDEGYDSRYPGRRRVAPAYGSSAYGRPYSREDFEDEGYEHVGGTGEPGVLAKAGQSLKSAVGTVSDTLSGAASSVTGAVAGAAGSVSDAASSVTGAVSRSAGAVSGAGSRVAGTASQFGRSASERAVYLRDQAYRGGSTATRSATEFADQQPLLVAAIGLAVGAVVGAAFRSTEAERRLMGEQADRLKAQAMELANDGYERAAAVASQTLDDVKAEAEVQGLTTSDAKGAAGSLTDRVRAVYEKGKETVAGEIKAAAGDAEKVVDDKANEFKASENKGGDDKGSLPVTSGTTLGANTTPKIGA